MVAEPLRSVQAKSRRAGEERGRRSQWAWLASILTILRVLRRGRSREMGGSRGSSGSGPSGKVSRMNRSKVEDVAMSVAATSDKVKLVRSKVRDVMEARLKQSKGIATRDSLIVWGEDCCPASIVSGGYRVSPPWGDDHRISRCRIEVQGSEKTVDGEWLFGDRRIMSVCQRSEAWRASMLTEQRSWMTLKGDLLDLSRIRRVVEGPKRVWRWVHRDGTVMIIFNHERETERRFTSST